MEDTLSGTPEVASAAVIADILAEIPLNAVGGACGLNADR